MKRVLLLLVVLIPAVAFAQKKPNINRALNAFKAGKLDEAKQIIDAATTYEKTMDKGDTWYYRGLIYAAIDTSSNEAYKSLAPDAFDVALESFDKAEQMSDGKSEYNIIGANGLPILKPQQMEIWASTYINMGATQYQQDDLEGALENFEKTSKILPDDTTAYFYSAIVANSLEKYDVSYDKFRAYIDKGGTSPDAYSMMLNLLNGPLDNKEKALELVREARQKFPDHADFGKVEIGTLIDMGKIEEAKTGLEEAVKKEPDNKILHFYLGYVNSSLGNSEAAIKSYEEALRIDPNYFDAQLLVAKEMYKPAEKIKREMANLGISAADRKKKLELDSQLVEKLKLALPYWEKAEKMNPTETEVLDALSSIYGDLGMTAQAQRIEQRYKELGQDN
ncbi:MAG TPA: tetratricopeptide repeat protein [Cyclobacteriaceae bacterium]|nr:tetratricopeptide repeat protein [Cyclobacteriaceae bacterium]